MRLAKDLAVTFVDAVRLPRGENREFATIPSRRVRFEVALFRTAGDQGAEYKANYHKPTRQRGMFEDLCQTRSRNPSLTFRVGMATHAQLQNARFWLG